MTPKILIAFLVAALFAAVAMPAQKGLQVSDDVLYDMVKRKLANDPVVKGGALTVDVKQAVVTLRGQVEMEKQKDRASKVVKKVRGVRSVNNQIRVTGKAAR
jgi:osmotically-inducible protein OsmY